MGQHRELADDERAIGCPCDEFHSSTRARLTITHLARVTARSVTSTTHVSASRPSVARRSAKKY